jgi:hypothetical protein
MREDIGIEVIRVGCGKCTLRATNGTQIEKPLGRNLIVIKVVFK